MDDITIVMPTLGRPTITRAVESLYAQTDPGWKLIIATDGPGIEIAEFDDPRVLVTHSPASGGIGVTRMHAMTLVDTEWTGHLDDDDILMPEYVERWRATEDDAHLVVFKMNNYGNIIPQTPQVIYGQIGMSFACRSAEIRRIGWTTAIPEDFPFLQTAWNRGLDFTFVDYVGYYVRPPEGIET